MAEGFRFPVKIPLHIREWLREEAARNLVDDAVLVRILIVEMLEEFGSDALIAENPRGDNNYSFSFSTTVEFMEEIGKHGTFRMILRGALRLAYKRAMKKKHHLHLRLDYVEAAA